VGILEDVHSVVIVDEGITEYSPEHSQDHAREEKAK